MADRVLTGRRLRAGRKLVSANGRFTLFMQRDGNLVLYQGGLDASGAYWWTDTWSLPAEQRPVALSMQADAHLVLYDAAGQPRWGSGTYGPGYIEPFLVLQDDGNLVIYHGKKRPVWASGTPSGQGRIGPRGLRPGTQDLDAPVDGYGRMPAVASGSTDLAAPQASSVDINGVAYIVTEQRRRLVNDVVEQAFLQDIGRMGVWPGQVIQGRSLLAGDLAAVGPLPRRPGTVEIVTDFVSKKPQAQSIRLANPTAAKVNTARRTIVAGIDPRDAAGQLKVDFQSASTLREVGVKLGVTVQGAAFGVDANAALNQTRKQSTVVAVIRQTFFTVTFTPEAGGASGIWPEKKVTLEDIEPFAAVGNPPLYIDSVQFGRFICVTAQGSFSSTDLTAALRVTWSATVSGSAQLDTRTREVLESSSVKIYTSGVPGHGQFKNLTNPIPELQEVYASGLKFSVDNPGAPVAFTCRHIADNTLAHVGLAADYSQPLSAVGQPVKGYSAGVFDGPGGGLVDTGIRVNPGDRVTIRAEGQIWSGVVFSGTHGPEGWPGHRADANAPLPTGTAYCLVHRFGGSDYRQGWKETARYWEGTPDPSQHGNLQLNVNDNNPYNGDPNKRWVVTVDVQRADAAAAGVYV